MLVEPDIEWTHIPSPLDGLRWPEIVHSTTTGGLSLIVKGSFADTDQPSIYTVWFYGRVEAFSAVEEALFVFTTGSQKTGALSVADASPELARVRNTQLPRDGLRHYLLLGGELQWQVLAYEDPVIEPHANWGSALAALRHLEDAE